MIPSSSLSLAAYGLRDLLISNIDELTILDDVKIGHPADTMIGLETSNENRLNLFIYNVSYDGYPADGLKDNPFYVRMHCLITAIGIASTDPEASGGREVSRGENELRLIGEVMRVLHQQPNISIKDGMDNTVASLQVVPLNINLDNLNHIWSTQNEISYRLSIAYELALAPIPLEVYQDYAPIAGQNNFNSRANIKKGKSEGATNQSLYIPLVEYLEIDINEETDFWMPQICYLVEDTESTSLHYVYYYQGDLDSELKIYIAGQDGATLKMFWDVWRRKKNNKADAWVEELADTVIPLDKTIEKNGAASDPYAPHIIDPDNIDKRKIISVKLPDVVRDPQTKNWQAMLYAVREWEHENPETEELIKTPIKSNKILLSGMGNE